MKKKKLLLFALAVILLSGCKYNTTYKIGEDGKITTIEERLFDEAYLEEQESSVKDIIKSMKDEEGSDAYSIEEYSEEVDGKTLKGIKIEQKEAQEADSLLGENAITVDSESGTIEANIDATTIQTYIENYAEQVKELDELNIIFEAPYPITSYEKAEGVSVNGNTITFDLKKYSEDTFKFSATKSSDDLTIQAMVGWGIVALACAYGVINYLIKRNKKKKALEKTEE